MKSHLQLLRELFPGKIMLGASEIAAVLGVSLGHLYNLSYQQKLPFKVGKKGERMRVSILEVALYLDMKMFGASPCQPEVSVVPVKRKRGRPRKHPVE